MRVALKAVVVALCALSTMAASSQARFITEPIDKSERAEAYRKRAIDEFVRRQIVYKVTKTSDTAVEVQVTARFLELPFDQKQVVTWAVFSAYFDGEDDRQSLMFADSRTLKQVGAFDTCHGLTLE